MFSTLRLSIIIFASLLLIGCKVDLYSGLDEKQGNEMLVLLLMEGIDVEKVSGKSNTIKLMVDSNQLSNAIEILSRNSYPRDKFATLEDVFPQGGLITTPTEEAARYTYAVSQDLAATVSNIDGVLTARVHLVLPAASKDKRKKNEIPEVAKASVFIKHSSNVNLDSFIPQIKLMVANSVNSLKYENVAVVIFPSVTTFNPIAKSSTDENLTQIKQFGSALAALKGIGPWLLIAIILAYLGIKFGRLPKQLIELRSASK